MRKHVAWYLKGMKGCRPDAQIYRFITSAAEMENVLLFYLDKVNESVLQGDQPIMTSGESYIDNQIENIHQRVIIVMVYRLCTAFRRRRV